MTFNVRTVDLAKINSMTKYPSIPTYHGMGDKGRLTAETVAFTGRVIGTEKVDGTNGRILLLPDETYILGSRENLLYAEGDLIGDPSMDIVKALRPLCHQIKQNTLWLPNRIAVIYGEVYGGNIGSANKQYSTSGRMGFRVFDICMITNYEALLEQSPEQIAAWRDAGGQHFHNERDLYEACRDLGLPLVHQLFACDAIELPTGHAEMFAFLQQWLPISYSKLQDDAGGKPEGIVLRSGDRRVIAKARFEDYTRTLKGQPK